MERVSPWHELSRETLIDCRIFAVQRTLSESPRDGSTHSFFRLQSEDWAQIVPVTPAGEVVMIRQYRHGAGTITLEIPGGLVDRAEDPQATALRECLEETGYRAASAVSMGAVNPNPALFGNRLHAFYAEGVERVADIQNTSIEQTELALVPLERLPQLLRSGAIDHALVAGTLWQFLHDRG